MLRAILFDFNGVIVGDEPLHFELFKKAVATIQVPLTQKEYYENYLGYDDYDCFRAILRDKQVGFDEAMIQHLTRLKNDYYFQEIKTQNLFIPGVINFIQKAAKQYYLGVVSGALRNEIEAWLQRAELDPLFQTIVSANEVGKGKPDPEGYHLGLNNLNCDFTADTTPLLPQECLVIEDSIWGIQAAHAAGMKCIALTTSYLKHELKAADWILNTYEEIDQLIFEDPSFKASFA